MRSPGTIAKLTLGELLLGIESGKSMQSTERIARVDELGVLKVSALTWGEFDPSEAKAVEAGYVPEERHRVLRGDVLISRCNTVELVGAVVRVDRDYPNRLLSDKTLRLVLDEKRCDPDYIVQVLRLPEARAFIEEHATGTSSSMRNISQDTIRATTIPVPCLEQQRELARRASQALGEINAMRAAVEQQLKELDLLSQKLLAHVFQS